MNNNFTIGIPYNEKYSHCWKLSKEHYVLMCVLIRLEPEIRSPDIVYLFKQQYGIEVECRWINKKLSQTGMKRLRGRPNKNYKRKRTEILEKLRPKLEKLEQIGIHFFIEIMDSMGMTDVFLDCLLKVQSQNDFNPILSRRPDSFVRLLHTLYGMTLDPRIHNFEEGIRSQLSYQEMNLERARQLTKQLEDQTGLTEQLSEDFLEYWNDKLGLSEKGNKIYIDGHGAPYYTNDYSVTGRMSVTEKIMAGTHYVICTSEEGYVLSLVPKAANEHLNKGLMEAIGLLQKVLGTDKKWQIIVDRECNGAEFGLRLTENTGTNLLTMLNKNQYKDLEDFQIHWVEKGKYGIGEWADDTKRQKDDRFFYIYRLEDKLVVLATTAMTPDESGSALSDYKSRWPLNENVLKLLVGELDLNVNVGNGAINTKNPKKKKLDKDFKQKMNNCQKRIKKYGADKKKRQSSSKIKQLDERIRHWKTKKKKYEMTWEKQRESLPQTAKTRKLEAQGFMTLIRAGILNVLFFLLSQGNHSKLPISNGIERLNDLLFNRNGYIEKTNNKVYYYFTAPAYKKDREYLRKFLEDVSNLKLKDKSGRYIIAKLKSGET